MLTRISLTPLKNPRVWYGKRGWWYSADGISRVWMGKTADKALAFLDEEFPYTIKKSI